MSPTARKPAEAGELWLEIVRRKVAAMRFGSVQVIVHEGQVTLVESTEKTRLASGQFPNGKATQHQASA